MLHIHNGDSSAEVLRQSNLPGEHLAWREALIDGPTPENVAWSEWRKLRARHLAEFYGVDLNEAESELQLQEEKLASYPEHDEVVLWFEHDLFCQTNLLYLLYWFAKRELGKTKLSLICIDEFPGVPNFRGLGELNTEQMASLFDTRHVVSAAQLKLATAGWQAFCSADPTAIERLLQTDTRALPFLQGAFQLHLERFPYVRNGLGRIENKGLELVHSGLHKFTDLFPQFADAEPIYGLGDAQFWNALKQMINAREPLLSIGNGNSSESKLTPKEIQHTTFEITEAGRAVLSAESDFVAMNGVDAWLGGVHLLGKDDLWRWDDQEGKLARV